MRRLRSVALLVLACVFVAGVARAQRFDGSLRVTVTDKTGGSVLDAKVTVTNEATNVSVIATASSAGTYVFPNLLVGSYTVTVEKEGFRKSVSKGVQVQSNQVAEVAPVLELGDVSSIIEVDAGAELVKTESSTLDATFSGKTVQDLPINTLGGDVKEFAVFAPGTTTQQGGVLGSGGSIGGTRPRFNGFNVDGVEDNKLDTNGPTQGVIQESVAEFTLLTNQFSAEYGHSSGGIFNIITKSGTNDWHGTGWGYNRNRNYDAADNQQKDRIKQGLATQKDRFDYNRAGASAGGPILHNRWFLYGAYEFQNEGLAASSPRVKLPTAAGLQTAQGLAFDDAVRNILKQFPVAPQNDAGTVNVNGNLIPVGFLTTVAPSFVNEHDFIVNSDVTLGKHQLSTRFLYERIRQPDFNASLPAPQFLGTRGSDGDKAIVSDVWSLSSRVINNARISYSRSIGPQIIAPAGFENFPNVIIDDLSSVNIGPEQNAPQIYTQNVYQLADTVNYVRGAHSFKFGIEGKKYIAPTNGLPRARGEWDYTTLSQLVNDYVPNGAPNKALRGAGSGSVPENYNAVYWFVQDDWKLTSRLTVNAGLRYEYTGVPLGDKRQALNAISNDPALGLIFRAPKADTNNFAPRLGFAYDPTGRGRWAIRGGAGFAYDVIPNNFAINSLPPQLQTEQKPAVTCALPNAPAWCTTWRNAANPNAAGQGFLGQGGLLTTNVPPATQALARAKTSSLIPDRVAPKIITWTLGVQHQLLRDSSVEVRYVGTRSLELPVQQRLNSASAFDPRFKYLGGGLTPLPTYFKRSDIPATVTSPASTALDFDNFNPQPFNPNPSVPGGFRGNLTTFPPAGSGIYHAVSVDFMHRFAKGLYFRTNYTFSKNIDNATNELFSSIVNPRRAQDGYNFGNERGLSALNIPQKFTILWVYELPNIHTDHGFVRTLAHGWEWSGSYIAESGQPVTPLSDTDSNANGDGAGDRTIFNLNGVGNTGTIVDGVCNSGPGGATSVVPIDSATGSYFCNSGHTAPDDLHLVGYVAQDSTARYVQAQFGAFANAGRNTVSTPGINIWNMSIYKNTKLTERFSVQFRADTYNTFNHRNFSIGLPTNNGALDQANNPNPFAASYVNVDSGSSNFLNAHQFNGGSRTMQLGLRLIW